MSENVVSLHGADITSDRKAEFLHSVATSFDSYVETYGAEPDAVVYHLLGLKQSSELHWMISGNSQGGATSILALASTGLMRHLCSSESDA